MEIAAIASVLTAMAAILKLVLDHLERQRAGFEKFMGNHMSKMAASIQHNSQAIEANTKVLRAFARRIEEEIDGEG